MIFRNEQGQPLILFDRSRLECAGECPRKYFWTYNFLGMGITRAKLLPPWELSTGSYIHEGIEHVVRNGDGRKAADHAVAAYKEELAPLIASLDLGERAAIVQREFEQQLDLVAALVYGWSLAGLPRFQASYELVDIEREEELGLLIGPDGSETEMRLLTRSDIISKYRPNGQYMLHNLKSVSNPDEKWRRGWQYDQQTLTERLAAEDRLGEQIIGVVIEGLVKGSKSEYPRGSGFYQHNSPLIYAWTPKKDGQQLPGQGAEFYSRYEWSCTAPHVMGNGRKCPGDKEHRLSGCYKTRIAAEYPGGIYSWIDYLMQNDRELLEQQFISLPAIGRSEFEVERWKRQVLPAEQRRQNAAEQVNNEFLAGRREAAYQLLDAHFPMETGHGNCLWPRDCPYLDLCWTASDPFDEDNWKMRVPNHPQEGELVQIELSSK